MQGIATPPLERRLKLRFVRLVMAHARSAPKLAAGIAALPGAGSAFTATQGAWRFLNNERVTLPALVEPLREVGRERAGQCQSPFLLLVHDWSKLTFHFRKADEVQLTHQSDVGYELTTALLVSADDGAPVAPMEMHLRTADGLLSTRTEDVEGGPHLDQVLPTMRAAHGWGLAKPVLHVIDREADSVDHYRTWDQAGARFLVRGDDRCVLWNDVETTLRGIAQTLVAQRKFTSAGTASYHGRSAALWVAETSVVLHRPAKKSQQGKKYKKPGPPITLRFIVAQIRSPDGAVLAEWLLLTNAPPDWACASKIARCYYWRWRIESFFKLLKSHGLQLEMWKQAHGLAIARRLLVAAMACVTVWQLEADQRPAVQELKTLLIRLSGRQMKRGRPVTTPALLAGLGTLLSTLHLLEEYDLHHLLNLVQELPFRSTA